MVEDEQARIVVRVRPNASQNEVLGFKDGVLHVRIAAPPIEGRANQELTRFLSEILAVSKSNLTIDKGVTARRKAIVISGLTQVEIIRRLERLNRSQNRDNSF